MLAFLCHRFGFLCNIIDYSRFFLGNCLGVLKVKAIVTDDEKQLSI